MIDEEVAAVIIAITVVAAVFSYSQLLMEGRVTEPFSAIGLLGPEMKIGGYPRTVRVNETIDLYLFIDNHEGRITYYMIKAKLGNKSTTVNSTIPAKAQVIATYETILAHGQNKTIPVTLRVGRPMTNARLIFELWSLYENNTLKYTGRWVHLWLNVTKT
ncbi:MAG: hypothetical protein DRJ41_02880 [Thermoprotei archaeon]|nr:MAG: hypothetical protein DRJ41_02880 [Thermoprotei archaeon]